MNERTMSYDLTTLDGVVSRVSAFTTHAENLEIKQQVAGADRRWVGFDRLVARLETNEHVPTELLLDAGLQLTQRDNPYLVNAGLTLLGTQHVSSQIAEERSLFSQTVSLLSSHIPHEEVLATIGERDPRLYNFLRSFEAMLGLQDVIGNRISGVDDIVKFNTLNRLINGSISSTHRKILAEAVQAPDAPPLTKQWVESPYNRHIPEVGERYRHIEGTEYTITGFVFQVTGYEETGEIVPSLEYVQDIAGHYPVGTIYTRSIEDFLAKTADGENKFEIIPQPGESNFS